MEVPMRRKFVALLCLSVPLLAWVFLALREKADSSRTLLPQEAPLARNATTESLAPGPKTAREFLERGNIWKHEREYDKAIKDYDEAIRLDPTNALAFVNRAAVWIDIWSFDKAMQDCDRAVQLDPKLAVAFSTRAEVWIVQFDADKAMNDCNEAIRLDPKSAFAFAVRANIWSLKHDTDKTLEDCEEALRLDPNCSMALNERGRVWGNKQDYSRAILDYNEALRLDQKNHAFLNNRGLAYVDLGFIDLALKDFDEAIRLNPKCLALFLSRGNFWRLKKDLVKAHQDVDKAIQMLKDSGVAYPDQVRAWANFFKGLCYVDQGDAVAAVKCLRQSFQQGFDVLALAQDQNLDPIRSDPEFQKLLQEILPLPALVAQGAAASAPPPLPTEVTQSPELNSSKAAGDGSTITTIENLHQRNADFVKEIDELINPTNKGQQPAGDAKAPPPPQQATLGFVPGPAPSQTLSAKEQERLRPLVEFPDFNEKMDFSYNSATRDGRGNVIDPAKKLAALKAQLTGSVDDGGIYVEMADILLNDDKQKDNALELARKAEEILRPSLRTTDPKDFRRLLYYSAAASMLNPASWEEQGRWVRRAVELAPKEWRVWECLGNYHVGMAKLALLGGRPAADDKNQDAWDLFASGLAPKAIQGAVKKHLDEARKYYDRAKGLAPNSEEQWTRRVEFVQFEAQWRSILKHSEELTAQAPVPATIPPVSASGKFGDGFSPELVPDLLAEFREFGEQCPNHIGAQMGALVGLLGPMSTRFTDREFAKSKKPLFTPAESKALETIIERVENITEKASGEAAPFCQRALVTFYWLHLHITFKNGDPGFFAKLQSLALLPRVERNLQRIIEASPKETAAAEVLEMMLCTLNRSEEAVALAKKMAQSDPSAGNRYLLAKCHAEAGHDQEASRELDAALQQDPDNPYCLAGKAVLLLRPGKKKAALNEETLAQAGQWLYKAKCAVKSSQPPKFLKDLELLEALQKGLTGETEIARIQLERLERDNPDDARYHDALQALPLANIDPLVQPASATESMPPPLPGTIP
jgi:tetratricopeptide (TPR) repeat protein